MATRALDPLPTTTNTLRNSKSVINSIDSKSDTKVGKVGARAGGDGSSQVHALLPAPFPAAALARASPGHGGPKCRALRNPAKSASPFGGGWEFAADATHVPTDLAIGEQ